jgi:hypothetical protein
LHLEGDVAAFDPGAFVGMLSALTGLVPAQIQVTEVIEDSVWVEVELPLSQAHALHDRLSAELAAVTSVEPTTPEADRLPPETYDEGDASLIDMAATSGFDELSVVMIALLLMGAGVLVLLAKSAADMPDDMGATYWIRLDNLWAWLALGASAIVFLEIFIRLVSVRYRAQPSGRLIIAVVLLAVGVGGLIDPFLAVPVLLFGLGIVVLIIGFGQFARRRAEMRDNGPPPE